jgi:hypothetical protein
MISAAEAGGGAPIASVAPHSVTTPIAARTIRLIVDAIFRPFAPPSVVRPYECCHPCQHG